ncbi:MAG: ABC transporter substrate-binding protein [Chloroflexota bacterium]
MVRRAFYCVMACFLALGVVFSACAPITPPATPSAKATPTPTPTKPITASPTPSQPAAPQPKLGGILNTWENGEPAGFDPQRQLRKSVMFGELVFSNLVYFDPTKRDTDPKNLVGDLAERWEISPDGKSYTFYLRSGIKWHDGKPFTADDVVYNLDKLADPKRSLQAGVFPAYQKSEKVNDLTVKVTLSRPQPSFLANLAGGYSVFVAPKAGDNYQSTDFLIGTGPFMFKSRTPGSNLSFVKNPNYFKKG